MKIYAIGLGPGDSCYLAPQARDILLKCDTIVGYTEYIKLIEDLDISGKEIISTGMLGEIKRCELAFEKALEGKQVAVISSGDAGIYGMAPLLYEMSEKYQEVEVIVIPGITAANAAASILGSPLSNDFVVISLSDLLTPWSVIEKRIECAAQGDFVICFYNPRSKKRSEHLKKACDILMKYKSPKIYCGYVKNALRKDVEYKMCSLEDLAQNDIDMFTTVIVGNFATKVIKGKLVTTRGYVLSENNSN